MTKFAMYVVNLEEGTVHGTNNVEDILKLENWPSEEYLIIHSTYGDWAVGDADTQSIEALPEDEDGEEE